MAFTFERALKLLAEKEPEKFACDIYSETSGAFYWDVVRDFDPHHIRAHFRRNCEIFETNHGYIHPIHPWNGFGGFTQDDIDEILAAIGWEYEVVFIPEAPGWTAEIWKRSSLDETDRFLGQPVVATKLEVAKAALIAVVNKEYGDQK
jgi:hypothetical protein